MVVVRPRGASQISTTLAGAPNRSIWPHEPAVDPQPVDHQPTSRQARAASRPLPVGGAPGGRFEVRREEPAALADAAIAKFVKANGPPVVVGLVADPKEGRAAVTASFHTDNG